MDIPTLTTAELVLRILVAAALGGVIGLERELSDQPAGLRTHILVVLGSCLFTLVGAYGLSAFAGNDQVNLDPTRVAAQVVSGIGFLGAGAILREGLNIRGLTTAATLWVTAAIGVAVGLGYWVGASVTTVTGIAALVGLKRVERMFLPKLRGGMHRFTITMAPELKLAQLAEAVEFHGGRVHSLKIITRESGERHLVGQVKLARETPAQVVADAISQVPGVTEAIWD
ncbi:MAG: putative Mg2+ transporter-C (MgtC) family protein [Actinomycetota bacterium]|jgi:putative Mg2+ transporter-C (MgtC) family protein|nr:putative Mg2+ transporter-C (MgtC) family protein [Actinomycetota bacterium]